MNKTSIPWTDFTWTVSRGCRPVSPGCANCYAARWATRFAGKRGLYKGLAKGTKWTGKIKLAPKNLGEPLCRRTPSRIFVNSMSDLFHERVPNDYIAAVFGVMASLPQHTFQVLTKRPERAKRWFDWVSPNEQQIILDHADLYLEKGGYDILSKERARLQFAEQWPLINAWFGASCEDQNAINKRLGFLFRIKANIRFLSLEPLIAPVNLRLPTKTYGPNSGGELGCNHCCNGDRCDDASHHYRPECPYCRGTGAGRPIDWVICGSESGPGARPFNEDWVRSARDQCIEADIPFFYKQKPGANGKSISMPELDGRQWAQFPGDHV